MPTPTEQLLSRTSYAGDGATTAWNFTFASGYIDTAHVKAYTISPDNHRTDLVVVPEDFIGEYQLSIIPAVPVGYSLTIYRDTPKDAPLVDFADGGNLTEAALDTLAKQAIFVAAETNDELVVAVGPELENIADQIAADATSASASAISAAASAATAEAAAASAAADVIPLVEAILQPLVDSATASEISAAASAATATAAASSAGASQIAAAASAVQAQTSADTATDIATALSGSFGFTNTAYDFGFVSDTTTYLDLDCGVLP